MKEKLYTFLKWIVSFVASHAMVLANVTAIVAAYWLSKQPALASERELLEQLCVVLGITGTALVKSMLAPKVPPGEK